MSEPEEGPPRERCVVRREVGRRLGDLEAGLEPVAEDLLGGSGPIDWLARDRHDRAVIVLIGDPGQDAALFTRGLAERTWVEQRIPDWLKLSPHLGLSPDRGVRCWLVCPDFAPETRAAHEALAGDAPDLARLAWCRRGGDLQAFLEPQPRALRAGAPAHDRAPAEPAAGARFRSGLREDDFDFSEAERKAFAPAEPVPSHPRDPAG
ncbi:MAG: hypothetical protein ACQGVK_24015 [Myxococcota bacterium]